MKKLHDILHDNMWMMFHDLPDITLDSSNVGLM